MTGDSTPAESVVHGFNLVMQLEDPAKLIELMQKLGDPKVKARVERALGSLDYVHFARFLPLWDRGLLLVVTEFDGDMQDYVLDFAAVLDAEFSLILSYMKDRPRLPVSRYPGEFWAYVERHTRRNDPLFKYPEPFSPYIGKTVLDLIGAGRSKTLPPRANFRNGRVDLADVQANVLLGYRAQRAVYVGLRFASAESGRSFLKAMSADPQVQVTPASPWPYPQGHCINVGVTHAGLQALGLPPELLQQFPQAFREGPRLRAQHLGDEGPSAPEHWRVGGFGPDGKPDDVHAMVSIAAKEAQEVEGPLGVLRELGREHGVETMFEQDAQALDAHGTVHFGYRDGISQPRIDGIHPVAVTAERRDLCEVGDFLLGSAYVNSRGGRYIGELPPALAQNATYGALRVIEQDVDAFETLLREVGERHDVDPELVAAKLMGRWRDGTPLVARPDIASFRASALGEGELDTFDYVRPSDTGPDGAGLRCPVGAHIRRLNPRGSLVVGIPWGRRVIRRGMPYGRANSDDARGLVGLFLCGDIEGQFEFLVRVWGNKDLAAHGIRGTKDPFAAGRSGPTPFRFRATESSPEITIDVPPLTRTVGSLYLLLPGLAGLKWLADAGWTRRASRARARLERLAASRVRAFDPTDPAFRADPYPYYAAFRNHAPVSRMPGFDGSHWVFSHALVQEVCERHDVFLKPGKDRDASGRPFGLARHFGDGLFFMDPPRHSEVRAIMNDVFATAIAGAGAYARTLADGLIDAGLRKGSLEWVGELAGPLPTRVFMKVMGIPEAGQGVSDAMVLNGWTRTALRGHDRQAHPLDKLAGATASMAMRAYFLALAKDCPAARGPSGGPSLIGGMQLRTGCPASPDTMDENEAMNTAVHFALGGYLSTEFLITTGIYNLLRHPPQWQALRADRSLLPQAVHEMLRFDAPFQVADRWVGQACTLGGVALERGAKLAVVYGSANRDPCAFRKPDRFDITRPISAGNFGFGHRVHKCIGEALAVEVASAALSALLDACPAPRIAEVGPWTANPYFRSLTRLGLLLR